MLSKLLFLAAEGERNQFGQYTDFEGLKKGVSEFKDTANSVPEILKSIGDSLHSIVYYCDKFIYYTTHPIEVLKGSWNLAVNNSFEVCLIITMAGTILYIIGIKKGAKIAKISFMSYVAIQVFNSVSKR